VLGNIQVLFENDYSDIAGNQFVHESNDFSRAAAQARKLGNHQGIGVGQHMQDFLDASLFAVFARGDGDLDKRIHFHLFFVSPLQDLQFLVVQILFVRRGSDIGDNLAHFFDCVLLIHFLPQEIYNL